MDGKVKSTEMKVNWYVQCHHLQSCTKHSTFLRTLASSKQPSAAYQYRSFPYYRKSSDLRQDLQNVCGYKTWLLLLDYVETEDSYTGLMELQMLGNNFNLLLNSTFLHKCIQARSV